MDPFSAPIPGQSLTMAPGSTAMEKPTKYHDLNDALEYVWSSLTDDPRQTTRLVLQLKNGCPAEFIARTLLFTGFSKGLWTVDLALLMGPTVLKQIVSIGHLAGVSDMVIKNPDIEQQEYLGRFVNLLDKKKPAQPDNKSVFSGLGV